MTVSRRLHITCNSPRPNPRRSMLRDNIEIYEDSHKHYDDWKKAEVDKAIKKKIEDKQKRMRMIPWFFFWAHILMITEYLMYRYIWG